MRRSAIVPAATLAAIVVGLPAAAQDESALRSYFEGRRVTLRMDMPGTSDGVDVHVDSSRQIDYERYGDRLKEYGVAIRSGETATVTLVKVKKDLIEFQIGGGGFGTFGDDTSTSVSMPLVEKSKREKELERAVKDEDDSHRRRELERELDEVRDRRERENRRIEAARAVAEERKKAAIAAKRLTGGSRFNLRYDGSVPRGITPVEVMAALSEYVDFPGRAPLGSSVGSNEAGGFRSGDPAAAHPFGSQPRKGMTRAEAERDFGAPVSSSERREGSLSVTTVRFADGEQQITAEFVEDVLVRYTIASR